MTKRIAVFASYDKQGKIHDYVLTYLRELKKFADTIIFIADNDVLSEEEKKLTGLADFIKCQRHGEYDFGSYKRGFILAKENNLLSDADELILCNDSCFLVAPLDPFFNDTTACDFYGAVDCDIFTRHLQSYFFVFKKNVFLSDVFSQFLNEVQHQDSLLDVVLNYEAPLTPLLVEKGFRYKSFYTANKGKNPTQYPLTLLQKCAFPLVKKKVFIEPSASKENVGKLLRLINNDDILAYFGVNRTGILRSLLKQKVKEFLFKKRVTGNGKLLVKICKIPVFVKKKKETA